jgi:hypothetical protein
MSVGYMQYGGGPTIVRATAPTHAFTNRSYLPNTDRDNAEEEAEEAAFLFRAPWPLIPPPPADPVTGGAMRRPLVAPLGSLLADAQSALLG